MKKWGRKVRQQGGGGEGGPQTAQHPSMLGVLCHNLKGGKVTQVERERGRGGGTGLCPWNAGWPGSHAHFCCPDKGMVHCAACDVQHHSTHCML